MRAPQPSIDIRQLIDRAVALHRAGNLTAAQPLYSQVLYHDPGHFDALHLLGVVRHQQGRHEEALTLIEAARRINPDSVEVLSNLGIVLQELDRNEEAVVAYDRALALNPRYAEALNNRGTALRALDRPAAAAMSFDRALVINPDYADALYNRAVLMADLGRHHDAAAGFERVIALAPERGDAHRGRARALYALGDRDGALASHGHAIALEDGIAARLERGILLSELGRHGAALEDYDCVLRLDPQHVAALSNRGAALQELGRDEEAQAAFDRALLLAPDNSELLGNRGAALLRSRRFDEALSCLDRALANRPADAGILSNRGNALLGLGRHAEAIESYDRALAIAPENALTLNNRGAALNESGLHEEALASCDDAVALAPDYAEAWYNRGNALKGLKRTADALTSYERALAIATPLPHALSGFAECAAKLCDWKRTAEVEPELQSSVLRGQSVVSPFTLIGYGAPPALQLACARRYAAHRFPTLPPAVFLNARRAHDRLRIAYLSANFNRHAMGYLMTNLFERHDRSRFELTGISFGPDDGSTIRARIAAAFEHFHDVRGLADRDVAKLIAEREIDIAVDLMGYTKDARPGILSHRPAPIQVNYLGYPGTMGADFIDYIVADMVVLPSVEEAFYAEKVVRLPDCYQVTDRERPIAETAPSRKDAGLPEQGFVFCSFNNTYKITAATFDVWMALLAEFDGSVLWLIGDDATVEDNLRREAATRGIAPDRLVFAPRMEQAEHLARHRLADLFLDTLPYNAHTTCSDALWAGLPVLTCRGESFAGRVAASLLQAVGLPELVTANLADYAALARWLAQDRDLLGQIRKRLAENRLRAPLFDTDLSRRHIEAAYATMWRLHRDGKPPQSFSVEPWHGIESAREGIAA